MSDVADILRNARERITDPRHFICGDPSLQAVNDQGHECLPGDPDAVRWTARGAVMVEEGHTSNALRALDRAASTVGDEADGRAEDWWAACHFRLCCQPHDVTLRIYDRAIAALEARR